jgi:serine/threonine protein kinase
MAPEVVMGGTTTFILLSAFVVIIYFSLSFLSITEEDYDASADIFSFGMVLVELITRKKPPMREPRDNFAFPIDDFT